LCHIALGRQEDGGAIHSNIHIGGVLRHPTVQSMVGSP
jgi:hypothetical protein